MGLIGSSPAAGITELPADLKKQLAPFDLSAAAIDGDVLRVQLARKMAKTDMLRGFVLAYCYPIWSGSRRPWGGLKLKRIEVIGIGGAQGVAFSGGIKECAEMGQLPDSKAYLSDRTWVCVAGNPCRPRRPGETTAADE